MGSVSSKCTKKNDEEKTEIDEEKTEINEDKSKKIIENIIVNILKQKNTNLSFVPDSVEAEIYEKILLIAIENIKEALSTTRIEFLGYEITLNVKPL